MIERFVRNEEVVGLIPIRSTKFAANRGWEFTRVAPE